MFERRLKAMTSVISKDKDWFVQQISEAVDYMFEKEGDRIKELLTRNLLEQLYFTGCSMHMDDDTRQRGKLVIEIDLPDPDGCGVVFENLGSLEVLNQVQESQLV